MVDVERIIFPGGEERELSKEEAERLSQPSAHQREVIKVLAEWSKNAVHHLKKFGYSTESMDKHIFIEKVYVYDEATRESYANLFFYPGKIPGDATVEEKANCQVLKAVQALWESIFVGDSFKIANKGIELGLAVAKAHTLPFEGEVKKARKPKTDGKRGGDSRNEENKRVKKEALKYYEENRASFRSKNKAAEEIAKKFYREFTTVRPWLNNL